MKWATFEQCFRGRNKHICKWTGLGGFLVYTFKLVVTFPLYRRLEEKQFGYGIYMEIKV